MERVRPHGFIEFADMQAYLQLVCGVPPAISDLSYLREKTKECLSEHDNQRAYFDDLRRLVRDINDEIIYRISVPENNPPPYKSGW